MEQTICLKKAEELYAYSCEHNFGRGLSRAWGLNSFRLAEQAMGADESAYLAFIGLHRFHSMSAHQRNFAYAFTNKRVIMTQMRLLWRTRTESIPLNKIRNIYFDNDASVGVVRLVLDDDTIRIGMTQESVNALSEKLTELAPLIQEYARQLA